MATLNAHLSSLFTKIFVVTTSRVLKYTIELKAEVAFFFFHLNQSLQQDDYSILHSLLFKDYQAILSIRDTDVTKHKKYYRC